MKKTILILIGLSIVSCKKEISTETENKKDTIVVKQENLTKTDTTIAVAPVAEVLVTPMDGFPKDVQGCSCYFAQDKEMLKSEKFYYVDDYQQTAYVKIGDKLEKLKFANDKAVTSTQLKKDFENDNYKGSLIAEKIPSKAYENEGNELWFYQGTLEIVDKKTGKKTTIPIYGECGC